MNINEHAKFYKSLSHFFLLPFSARETCSKSSGSMEFAPFGLFKFERRMWGSPFFLYHGLADKLYWTQKLDLWLFYPDMPIHVRKKPPVLVSFSLRGKYLLFKI